MIHVGVVARGNDLAAARVLADSLAAVHPDWPLTVLVAPGRRPALAPDADRFEVLSLGDLSVGDLDRLSATVPPAVLAALLRPALAVQLLATGHPVLVLGPDAVVHAPLGDLEATLERHDAVLVPRTPGTLPPDGERPDAADLLDAGEIDDELVAIASRPGGRELADWWLERGHEAAEQAAGIRGRPGQAAPAGRLGASPLGAALRVFGDRIALLDDPAWNVSHWNLHERPIAREAGGGLTADGRVLRIMRWLQFRPDRPWWLSDAGTRVIVLDDPLLTELAGARSAALGAAGWLPAADPAGPDEELTGGVVLDERLRRLHGDAIDAGEDFGDLMAPAVMEAFVGWLREPAPRGALTGITRYAFDVWLERADVQEAYPDLDGADSEGFIGWLWVHGIPELQLQAPLLPPAPSWFHARRHADPVLVTGYFRGNLGLGEAARGYASALVSAGVPVGTRSIATDPPVERRAGDRRRPDERAYDELALAPGMEPGVALLCVNADQLPELVDDLGSTLEDVYRIGQWAWETDLVPDRWERSYELVDEIWVYSSYVAEHLARAAPVPVLVVPLPVEAPHAGDARVPFELPDAFTFLFAFDFFSTLQRKNPLGLVEAFERAFAPGEGPVLLLKTINAAFRPHERERLRWAIGDRPDIRVVDASLTPQELAALFARADCFVSLHRSEGYGLTLAESMALGKPVVATGFSGNTDFMTPANSYLVDWTPARVGPEAEHYPEDATWAEPSIEHAAAVMREVWTDQEAARDRGARAAADIHATLSRRAVGDIARARLEHIATRRGRGAGDASAPWPIGEVERRVGFDLGGSTAQGPRGAARRAVLRAMRPYTVAERGLDEAVAGSLRRLWVELSAERAARQRDRDRIARLERKLGALLRGQ